MHHVDERRHAAGNAVHVHAVAVQQFERIEIAAAAGDVRRDAVSRIRAGLEQHAPPAARCPTAQTARPQRRSRKLGMPVPVVLGVGIRAERAEPAGNRDESLHASGVAVVHATCGTRRAAAPSSAVRPAASRARDGRAAAPPRASASPSTSAVCSVAGRDARMEREKPVRRGRTRRRSRSG